MEKERTMMKELIIGLQSALDEQGRDSEKLFFELTDCIYILQ